MFPLSHVMYTSLLPPRPAPTRRMAPARSYYQQVIIKLRNDSMLRPSRPLRWQPSHASTCQVTTNNEPWPDVVLACFSASVTRHSYLEASVLAERCAFDDQQRRTKSAKASSWCLGLLIVELHGPPKTPPHKERNWTLLTLNLFWPAA